MLSFRTALTAENHTLKRALTDPRPVNGIGSAYSDEILHAARFFAATRPVLGAWVERLRGEAARDCPEKATAFRDGMAVPTCFCVKRCSRYPIDRLGFECPARDVPIAMVGQCASNIVGQLHDQDQASRIALSRHSAG